MDLAIPLSLPLLHHLVQTHTREGYILLFGNMMHRNYRGWIFSWFSKPWVLGMGELGGGPMWLIRMVWIVWSITWMDTWRLFSAKSRQGRVWEFICTRQNIIHKRICKLSNRVNNENFYSNPYLSPGKIFPWIHSIYVMEVCLQFYKWILNHSQFPRILHWKSTIWEIVKFIRSTIEKL